MNECHERFNQELENTGGSPGGSVAKTPPANAGDTRDGGLIPGLGRSPEEEMATHSGILARKRSWIEEPGGL